MGSSSSKAASAAKTASKLSSANTARKYPTRSPPTSSNRTNVRPERPVGDAPLGPNVHPETRAAEGRDEGIERDSSDPDLLLNARMRQLGPVSPNPTMSNSSTFNTSSHLRAPQDRFSTPRSNLSSNQNLSAAASAPQFQPSASNPEQSIFPTGNNVGGRENPAVSLLTARYRLAEEAEREFASIGRKGSEGRTFLDVVTLRQVLVMRERGVEEGEIERKLGLGRGVVGKLGRRDVVGVGS